MNDLVNRYLHGWCAQFAYAVHARTGWTMVGVHGVGEYGGPPRHVACRAPDGTFVDVRGTGLTRREICAGYDAAEDERDIRPVSPMEMVARFTRERGSYARAFRDVARILPELPVGRPNVVLNIGKVGNRYLAAPEGLGEKVFYHHLDVVAKVLAKVPNVKDVWVDAGGIVFDPWTVTSANDRRALLFGWIESVLVAEVEGAPSPDLRPFYPYARLDPILVSDLVQAYG